MDLRADLVGRPPLHQVHTVHAARPDHLRPSVLEFHNVHPAVRLQAIEAVHPALHQIGNGLPVVSVAVIDHLDPVFVPRVRKSLYVGVVKLVQELRRKDRALFRREILRDQNDRRERRVRNRVDACKLPGCGPFHVLGKHLRVFEAEEGVDLQSHLVEDVAEACVAVVQDDGVAGPALQCCHFETVLLASGSRIGPRVAQARYPPAQPLARSLFVVERPTHVPGRPVVVLRNKSVFAGHPLRTAGRDRGHDQVHCPANDDADIVHCVVESLDLSSCVHRDNAGVVAQLFQQRRAIDRLVVERRADALAFGHHVTGEQSLDIVSRGLHDRSFQQASILYTSWISSGSASKETQPSRYVNATASPDGTRVIRAGSPAIRTRTRIP